MKRILERWQSDPVGIAAAALLLVGVIFEIFGSRTILGTMVFGLTLGLVIGYNLRLVVERRQ